MNPKRDNDDDTPRMFAENSAQMKEKKEDDFKYWMGPGPNSEQIREIGSEWVREMRQNLGNPYQIEDNKARSSATPKGATLRVAPGRLLRRCAPSE